MEHEKPGRRTLFILALIFLLALGLRGSVFVKNMNDMRVSYDPRNYWIMSHQLVDDGIYGYAYDNPSGTPNARVMPGYPLFLAAVYKLLGDKYLQITAVRMLQVIISSLSTVLGFYFVRKVFKKDGMALLTALFIAIYPTYVLSSFMLLTETLALFTMLLYFCLLVHALESGKAGINLITGIAFGIHLMIRPALLPLFILPFIIYFLTGKMSKKDRPLYSFIFQVMGVVIVLAPWWIRNVITLGRFILTAEGSGNPFLAGTYPYFQDYFLDVTAEIRSGNDTQMAYGIERLLKGLKNETWLYLKWYTIGKIGYMFQKPYLDKMFAITYIPSYVIHYGILIPGVIGSIIHSIKNFKAFWFYFYGLVILGLQLMFVPDPRFVYLIMFFIMAGAAHLISSIPALIKKR